MPKKKNMPIIETLIRTRQADGSLRENKALVASLPDKPGFYKINNGTEIRVCQISLGNGQKNCRKVIVNGLFGGKDRRVIYLPPSPKEIAMQQVNEEEFLLMRASLERKKRR